MFGSQGQRLAFSLVQTVRVSVVKCAKKVKNPRASTDKLKTSNYVLLLKGISRLLTTEVSNDMCECLCIDRAHDRTTKFTFGTDCAPTPCTSGQTFITSNTHLGLLR